MIPFLLFIEEHSNGILKQSYSRGIIEYSVSGSSSQRINGTIQTTKPEYAFDQIDKNYDWCSNCGLKRNDFPWIILSLKNMKMKIKSYYLKSGCCTAEARCCCYGAEYCLRCCLYSWALQISEDNKTWETVHEIKKDREMEYCAERSYDLDKPYTTRYIRLIQTEACPGDPPCIAINKIEFFGDVCHDDGSIESNEFISYHDDDDDISIIGHISKNQIK